MISVVDPHPSQTNESKSNLSSTKQVQNKQKYISEIMSLINFQPLFLHFKS